MDDLTAGSFRPHLREELRLDAGSAGTLALELVKVSGGGAGEDRRPFSVEFLGPREPILQQRIYRLEHHALGILHLFIVPIARDAEGVRYEAVFN